MDHTGLEIGPLDVQLGVDEGVEGGHLDGQLGVLQMKD